MSILLNVEIEDNDIAKAVDKLFEDFKHRAERGVWAACMDTAEYIRSTYTGGLKGFKDRTGQLRRSIKGGLNEVTDNEISGFIGAGDERIGSDGKATKDYALFVEFPFLRPTSKRDTAFLLPGVMESTNRITKSIIQELKRL